MAAVRPHDAESVRLEQLEEYLGNFDTGKRCNCGGNIIDNASLSAHGGFVTHTYSCNKKCNQSHTDDAIEGAGGYVPLDRREPRT